jgi:hypothetical protein
MRWPLAANAASTSWHFLLLSEPLIFGPLLIPTSRWKDDVKELLKGHKELAALLLQEPEPWSA